MSHHRLKHSSVDLQQTVVRLDVYRRPLDNCIGGVCGSAGVVHEAAIATTETGTLYLVEKGISKNDDINYQIRYREGECRIAQVTHRDIQDWRLVRSVEQVKPGVTLEDLFDACGSTYSFLADNCWNGTHRMRAAANEAEDGLAWQTKGALVAGGFALAVGAVAVALGTRKNQKEKRKN